MKKTREDPCLRVGYIYFISATIRYSYYVGSYDADNAFRFVNLATTIYSYILCMSPFLHWQFLVCLTFCEKVLIILSPTKTKHRTKLNTVNSANYFLSLLIFKILNGFHLAPKPLTTIRPAVDYIAHLHATPDFAGAFIVT